MANSEIERSSTTHDYTGPIGVGGGFFRVGRDPILMDVVKCDGTEKNLTECQYQTEPTSCQHSEDVGVICQGQLRAV